MSEQTSIGNPQARAIWDDGSESFVWNSSYAPYLEPESGPGPSLHISPIEEQPAYEDGFAEHVAALKKHVDEVRGVDPDGKSLLSRYDSGALGTAAAVASAYPGFLGQPILMSVGVTGAALVAGYRTRQHLGNKSRRAELDELSSTTQGDVGQAYTLYRAKDDKRTANGDPCTLMRWEVDQDVYSETWNDEHVMAAELKHLAACAEESGVDYLAVSAHIVNGGWLAWDAKQRRARKINAPGLLEGWNDFVSEFRGIPDVDPMDNERVYVLSPKDWKELVETESRRLELGSEVDVLIKQLEGMDDRHPLVKLYREYEKDAKVRGEMMVGAARKFLDRFLTETETYANPDEIETRKTGAPSHKPLDKTSNFEITGHMSEDGQNVVWNTRFGPHKQDSLAALGLGNTPELNVVRYDPNANVAAMLETAAQNLIDNPGDNKQRAMRAAAILIQRKLAIMLQPDGQLEPAQNGMEGKGGGWAETGESETGEPHVTKPEGTHYVSPPPERPDMSRPRRQRLVTAAAVFALTLVGIAGLESYAISNPPPPAASSASGAGNTDATSPNLLVANLEGHNMPTDGYWSMNESTDFVMSDWTPEDSAPDGAPVSIPLAPPEGPQASWTKVTLKEMNAFKVGDMEQIDIPVLQATKPIAGEFDGHPVTVQQMENGTYTLLVPPSTRANPDLEYWVSFADDASVPKPTHPLTYALKSGTTFDNAKNQAVFNQAIPGLQNVDGTLRAEKVASYIRNNFNYSLDPLPNNKTPESYDKWSNFLSDVMNAKEANCAVASDEVEFSEPQGDVGIAGGFLNKPGSTANTLSTHEAHQWNVLQNGAILDGTPVHGASQSTEAFFDAPVIESDAVVSPETQAAKAALERVEQAGEVFGGLLALGALGIGLKSRRRFMDAAQSLPHRSRRAIGKSIAKTVDPVRKMPRTYANYRLNRADPAALNHALATIEYVTYGPNDEQNPTAAWHDQPISRKMLRSASGQRARSAEQVKNTLLDPRRDGLRADALLHRLKRQAKVSGRPANQRRHLKRTARVVAWAQRAVDESK